MSETLQTILAVLIMIALFILTRLAVLWRFRLAAAAVLADLKRLGALDEQRAVTLPYAVRPWHRFGLRNYKGKSLDGLVTQGVIGMTVDGRYYLRSGTDDESASAS